MRILELFLQGVGPFSDAHRLDFVRFEESGLFLLEGATGSGKTTIIDAIVFALYGTVSGNEKNAEGRLRSTLCEESEPSQVRLRFEVGSGIYEVTRSPSYRLDNGKSKNHSVRLDRVTLDEHGEVATAEGIAVKKRETDAELAALIGLTDQQFLQTVVLPQGKFSAFLTATSDERRKILQDIFGTRIYADMQESLRTRAKSHTAAVELAKSRLVSQADSMADVVEPLGLGIELPRDGLVWDQLFEVLESITSAAKVETGKLDAVIAEATAAERTREAELAEGTAKRDQWHRRAAAGTRVKQLEENRAAIELAQQRLAAAREANAPAELYARLEEAVGEYDALVASRDREREAIGFRDSEDIEDTREALLREIGELKTAVALEAALVEKKAAVDKIKSERDSHLSRAETLAQGLVRSAENLEGARQELAALGSTETQQIHLAQDEKALAAHVERKQRRNIVDGRIEPAAEARDSASSHAATADAHARSQRKAWLASIVGVVAKELHDGQPCPVCGSESHPHPADTASVTITADDVEAAATASQTADRNLSDAATALAELITERAALAPPGDEPDDLELAQQAVADRRRSLEDALAKQEALTVRISSLTDRLASDEEDRSAAGTAAAALSAEIAVTEDALASQEAECALLRGDFDTVAARHDHLTSKAHTYADIIRITAELAAAEKTRDGLGGQFDAALGGTRFGDVQEMLLAALPREEQEALQEEVSVWKTSTAEAAAELDRLGGPNSTDEPDLTGPREALTQAQEAKTVAHGNAREWATRVAALQRAIGRLGGEHEAWQAAQEAAGPVVRLAGLANASIAGMRERTPLGAYVLMRRFDEVLAAANPRLRDFSSGRYELVRKSEGFTGVARVGLGIDVLDLESEALRNPQTLSGGETFYTSLALALGLAEVVTAEAGGINFDTAFIDEGFGSLDSETLDNVMHHLEGLRAGGRTVGIISHVPEMRTRIPDGIHVWRSKKGGSDMKVRL